MKVALSIWNGRIAPVFDVSRRALVMTLSGERIVEENALDLPEGNPGLKVTSLVGQGVTVLICGAISQPVLDVAYAHGLRVVPYVAGPVLEVQEAYATGAITSDEFRMPGYGPHRRRSRVGRRRAGGAGRCRGER